MTVRIPSPSELGSLLEVCRELYDENALMPWSETLIRSVVENALAGRGALLGVIGDPGAIEAMIMLSVGRLWYTHEPHLEEQFVFVRQAFRNDQRSDQPRSTHARELLEFAKSKSDELGIPLLIGILTHARLAGKVRLYQRTFGDPVGSFFLYKPKTKA
jgi:hypothetical protein